MICYGIEPTTLADPFTLFHRHLSTKFRTKDFFGEQLKAFYNWSQSILEDHLPVIDRRLSTIFSCEDCLLKESS